MTGSCNRSCGLLPGPVCGRCYQECMQIVVEMGLNLELREAELTFQLNSMSVEIEALNTLREAMGGAA